MFATDLGFYDYLDNCSSIAVCAYDAGSAALIREWLHPYASKVRLCVAGPATRAFSGWLRSGVVEPSTLSECLSGVDCVVSGSGWASDLEHQARLTAQNHGIPSFAVVDHWVNYRERFQRLGHEVLPDLLLVGDVDAARLARTAFPEVPVLQLPNTWLEAVCRDVNAMRANPGHKAPPRPRQPARRLLYLLEPIRVPWPIHGGLAPSDGLEVGEFQALRYWLEQLPGLIARGWVGPPSELEGLALRMHPSEPGGKYDGLIAEVSTTWPIELDRSSGLGEALAWADAAFGCETQALVAAMACGLPAFSTMPPWAPPCRLPQVSLHHLSRLESP